MMTKENKKQFKQEIENILRESESEFIFDKIYDLGDGVHIVLMVKNAYGVYYLDINVSNKTIYQYYKENGKIQDDGVFNVHDLKLSLDIINWWYK